MLNEQNSPFCPLDNCPIMLRILPLADDSIFPQAKLEIYFSDRVGQEKTLLDRRFNR